MDTKDHEVIEVVENPESERRKSAHSLSRTIIGAALKVHTALGPGLMERAYEACLAHELRKAGCNVVRKWLSRSYTTE